MPMKLSSNSRW